VTGDARPIGYLVPEFPSQTHAFFWRELGAIEEAGHPVQVFSTRRPPPGACPHGFAEAARARTRYLFPFPPARIARLLAARPAATARAAAYVAALRETAPARRAKLMGLIGSAADLVLACRTAGIDHVHIHSCAEAAHLGALAHILDGISYSLTLHGDLPVYGTDHRAKMARARFVSPVTRPLQAVLEVEIGTPPGRFPVIWMGVDTARFAPPEGPRADGSFRVATVARLNRTKGHLHALRAVARLREAGVEIRYRIAGDGPERAAIEAEVAALDLGDRVELLGSLGEDAVLALLHGTDALLLTSFGQGEASPVAVMEAMACGVPPVCSVIGGTADMIEDGVDGFLVPQKDEAAIADALHALATDPDRRAAMGRAARATALRLFDHRVNAMALHREIAGRDAPVAGGGTR
jgi:glycosyltransferase involved in cell wall biosynthesis